MIPGKNPVKEHKTEFGNEARNKQNRTSANQRREERKQNTFPTNTSIIVLCIQNAFTQATMYLINRQVG